MSSLTKLIGLIWGAAFNVSLLFTVENYERLKLASETDKTIAGQMIMRFAFLGGSCLVVGLIGLYALIYFGRAKKAQSFLMFFFIGLAVVGLAGRLA